MKPTEDGTRPDGGTTSPFETVADTQLTRREQLSRLYDDWVRAPFGVLWSDWRARLGLIIIMFYVLMGTVGVLLIHEPRPLQVTSLTPPFQTMDAPLGADEQGQDVLALMVHATPAMFKMILAGAVFSVALATGIGTASGYKGGTVDRALMVLTDIVLTIPGLPLVIILGAALQPRNPFVVGLILGIDNWPGLARALRSQVLTLREFEYVEAERTMGTPLPRILMRDIVPQLMPYISINFMGASRRIIFESVALYFLGVLPFSNLNWGVVLNQAYNFQATLYNTSIMHWLIIPMVTITLLSLGLILFSQGLDRVFNPRVRARHAQKRADITEEGPTSGGTAKEVGGKF